MEKLFIIAENWETANVHSSERKNPLETWKDMSLVRDGERESTETQGETEGLQVLNLLNKDFKIREFKNC